MKNFTPAPVRFALWDNNNKRFAWAQEQYTLAIDRERTVHIMYKDLRNFGSYEANNPYTPLLSTGLKAKTKDGQDRELVDGDIVALMGPSALGLRDHVSHSLLVFYDDFLWIAKCLRTGETTYLSALVAEAPMTILCHALSDEGQAMLGGEE